MGGSAEIKYIHYS